MTSISNPRQPIPLQDVFSAIESERTYQLMRWGRSEGQATALKEAPHDGYDFLCYVQHYLNLAIAEATTKPSGSDSVSDIVRKIAALAVAHLDQNTTWYPLNDKLKIREAPKGVGVAWYIMRIQALINQLLRDFDSQPEPATYFNGTMTSILGICVGCLERFGVQPRDLRRVENARDHINRAWDATNKKVWEIIDIQEAS